MSRRVRLVLVVALTLVLVGGAGVVGSRAVTAHVRAAIQDWAEAQRVKGMRAGWDRYTITGLPFAVRVTFDKPVYGRFDAAPGFEATAPVLVGEARPWALRHWHLTAPEGARLAIEPGAARPPVTLATAQLGATVAPSEDAGGPRR